MFKKKIEKFTGPHGPGRARLCLAVPFEAESLVVVVHLQSDWPPQAPVDVEQPLEDEQSVFLRTRRDRQQSSGSRGVRGGYPAGCPPRRLRVRCTCRPRRPQQPRGQTFHGGETPIRWDQRSLFSEHRGEVTEYFHWVTYAQVEKILTRHGQQKPIVLLILQRL